MAIKRFKALEKVLSRKAIKIKFPKGKISDYFGINVFDKKKMQKYLSKQAYKHIISAIESGKKIDRKMANQIAMGMKSWAMDKNATHYTHWFQPLNDATAEKHDAFFNINKEREVFESFDGELLVQQESDASSLPSGGIRNTFEARGYTAWDPSSPAFIVDKTLCIPTIFVSYTGEALDYKTPLLKANQILDEAAVKVCQFFDKNVKKVTSMLGCEQEYFLIDKALYLSRPDLILTERTLVGHSSAKDQQLNDHYFSSIPERVSSYMKELEIEAYKLGIPLKTRHNEVAPNQFECAPIFEETNLANDHNQLLMDTMKKLAHRHNFVVLFHEKPYKEINGSGKHCNWSLKTNTGINLLSPSKNTKLNLQFIVFLVNTIKAVYENADLLRASIVSHGNEHRLGGNEAPPSIISIFLGKQLTKILDNIENQIGGTDLNSKEDKIKKLNIEKIPEILLDNTDRNRTSPFAFTGNRFEFRAVGSSANCAAPMIVLNAAVANQLNKFAEKVEFLISKNRKKNDAIFEVLKEYISVSKKIRFEGDGYSEDWVSEAKKRGLNNIKNVPEALKYYINEKTINLFENQNILSKRELQARYEIRLEKFIKNIQIESRILGDLSVNHIIPIAIKYQNFLIKNLKGLKDLFGDEISEEIKNNSLKTIKQISVHILEINKKVDKMIKFRKEANSLKNIEEKAKKYSKNVKVFLNKIRYHADKLEMIIEDEMWTLPKYRELLFTR